MKSVRSTTTTTDALLGMLTMGPVSGYELRQRIERTIGNFWSESFGQIYPALRKLAQDGLIEEISQGSKSNKGSKVYRLTDAGREHLQAWLEVAPWHRPARNELLLKLFFGGLAPSGSLRAHVLKTRARYVADLVRYEGYGPVINAKFAGNPGLPYWLTTLDFGLREARMVINWCDETLTTLDRLESEAVSSALPEQSAIQPDELSDGVTDAY